MAPSQTCTQQSFIVCVLVRPWPRRRCAAAAAVCCREEATRASSGDDPWRAASLTWIPQRKITNILQVMTTVLDKALRGAKLSTLNGEITEGWELSFLTPRPSS